MNLGEKYTDIRGIICESRPINRMKKDEIMVYERGLASVAEWMNSARKKVGAYKEEVEYSEKLKVMQILL